MNEAIIIIFLPKKTYEIKNFNFTKSLIYYISIYT